jgi:NTP pyrophosphatase (non-canonical NTP hydrolase)
VNPILTSRPGGAGPSRIADDDEIPTAWRAKQLTRYAAGGDYLSWDKILVEEVAEAVEAAANGDLTALREELVQVAAVAVAWIEAINRRIDNAESAD